LAMFLLTLVNGMIVPSDTPVNVGLLFGGVGLFIGFFALLAAVVVPRTAAIFERIKNEELFVLFALGTVFLAASLAEAFRIPAIVGAFFMGMVFADTRIAGLMKVRMESLREAILYATVGARAIRANPQLSNDYAGTYLTPFAGILCIVMSSLAPILMGRSNRIAAFFASRLPKSLRFGAELVKRTLKTIIMPNFLPIYRRKRLFQASLIFYAAWIIDLPVTTGAAHLAMSLLTPVFVFGVWASARHAFREPVR